MTPLLQRAWQNKHTSGAAIAYLGAKLLAGLGAIWFPAHAAQCQQTAELIESGAVGYGLIMAGDAGTKPTTAPEPPKP